MLYSITDVVCAVVFLFCIMHLRERTERVTLKVDGVHVTAANYTVFVLGLPKDVTEEAVMKHFNTLYDLGANDWTFPGFYMCIGRKTRRRKREDTKARRKSRASRTTTACAAVCSRCIGSHSSVGARRPSYSPERSRRSDCFSTPCWTA